MKLKRNIIIIFILLISTVSAQNFSLKQIDYSDYESLNPLAYINNNQIPEENVSWNRVIFSGGIIFTADISLWMYFDEAYYNGQRTNFHLKDDWYNYTLNIDKAGHFHSAATLSKLSYKVFKWTNMNEGQAMWLAVSFSWLHMLQMEIFDAHQERWGFSLSDLAANTAGAIYPNLQKMYPVLEGINMKMSYYPAPRYLDGTVKSIVEDYEGRTYWLCIDVHNYLPGGAKNYWPEWLGVAIGYGGDKLIKENGNFNSSNKKGLGEQEWYVSLDYNLIKLFKPDKNTFWYELLDILNMLHFPAPAIRVVQGSIVYGLYF